jgi:hypothetical protein
MAFKIEWKPVLQALALSEYHPEFADNVIMVCVNPAPQFLQERQDLLAEYSKQLVEAKAAADTAETSPNDQEAERLAMEKGTAFDDYLNQTFVPKMQDWFAGLWSFGEEKFTVEDLDEYEKIDPHLLAWLKRRSIEMIDEHRAGQKKA